MKHIPNVITLLNLLTGAIGIILVLNGSLFYGLYCVLLGAFFDFLDGMVARLLNTSSLIGKELDSLADVISFGLLPAIFMFQLIASEEQSMIKYLGLLIAAFSALRLAKFNIDDNQSDKFIGLPTPANAIMITSIILLPGNWITLAGLVTITLVSSALLVSPIELLALKFKSYSFRGNEVKFLLIFTVLAILLVFGWTGIPFIIPLYLIFSVIGNYLLANKS